MLIQRIARRGPPARALQGRRYFRDGAVHVEALDAERVFATVQGGRPQPYRVRLRWTPPDNATTLHCACSCPDFAGGFTCKHVWAVLYALDAETDAPVAGTRGLTLARAPELLDATAPAAQVAAEPARPARRAWIDALAPLRDRGAAAAPSPRRVREAAADSAEPDVLWYVVDVPASRALAGLVIQLCMRQKRRDDTFETRLVRGSLGLLRELESAADRELVALLHGTQPAEERLSYLATARDQIGYRLDPVLAAALLPRLVESGRLVVRRDATRSDPDCERPLAFDAGAAWSFQLEIVPQQGGKSLRLAGTLSRDTQQIDVAAPLLIVAPGFVVGRDAIGRLDAAAAAALEWITLLRDREPVVVPAVDRDRLVEMLAQMPGLPPLLLPDEFPWRVHEGVPRGRFDILAPATAQSQSVLAMLRFDYDGRVIDAQPGDAAVIDREARTWWRRNDAGERVLAGQLVQLGLTPTSAALAVAGEWRVPRRLLATVIGALRASGWDVRAEGRSVRQPTNWSFAVTSGIDWFDVTGTLAYDGESVALPQLLAAARRGESFVPLGDGSLAMLPEEWLARFAPVVELGQAHGDEMRFVTAQAGLLDALLAEQDALADVDARFAELRQRLRGFDGVAPRAAPAGFVGTLREYQRLGLGWLTFLRQFGLGGCLADDMGLGKTVQVLALLDDVRGEIKAAGTHRPSLVVVPRSLVHNWIAEAARFTPALRVIDYTGADRHARRQELETADLVVTTYGTLRRDAVRLREVEFEYAILDEAQAIKNAASLSAKASRLLRARHRLAVTGTPVENHVGELWSLFEFLNPGMLGRATAFRGVRFESGDAHSNEWLTRALRPYILRRTKERVLTELPAKTEQTLYCDMERKQRRLYDELRDHYRRALGRRIDVHGLARSKMHVLEALLRLRQAACHPGLIDPRRADEPSAKLVVLRAQLDEVLSEGHKALVFSQFTQLLAIVRRDLDARGVVYEYLDGRTRDRAARVARFQQDEACGLFLVSLKAGGQGLNLTAADYVFLLDPWWNPAVEAQAIDRTHRIGQTRRVFAYRLLCKDTVEVKIAQLQARKRELVSTILADDAGFLRSLSADDVRELLA